MIQFVTFGTENYEPLLDVFHKSIKLTCKENYTLNYYSLNYDSKLKDENLIKAVKKHRTEKFGRDVKKVNVQKTLFDEI